MLWLWVGGATFLVAAGYSVWRPYWATASRAEVDRILGPELTRPVEQDPVKQDRIERAVALVSSLNLEMFPSDVVTHIHDLREDAMTFWALNKTSLRRLAVLVDEGQWQSSLDSGPNPRMLFERFSKGISLALLGSERPSDRNRFRTLANLACRFSQRFVESARTTEDYEVAADRRRIVDCAITDSLEAANLKSDMIADLVEELDKPLPDRAVIREVVRTEFRDSFYDYLPNPEASEDWKSGKPRMPAVAENAPFLCGNYSAKETAKEMKLLYSRMMDNVSGNYRTFDPTVEKRVASMAAELSNFPDPSEDNWRKFQFRYGMRRIGNSFGRYLLSTHSSSDALLAGRMLSEATHELVRGEAALVLYSRRNGSLPRSLSALVKAKILKRPLIDPYTAEPLHYDPKRRRLWSVGINMTDEHGLETKFRDQTEQDLICPVPR